MTTKTDQTSKEFKAKSVIDQPNRSIVMAALFGTALILVALIVFTALNGRVGTISQAANVQNSTDSIVTLGEIHALESGYNPRGVTEAEADSIVSLGMAHALESGYTPKDSIINLGMVHALESGYNPGE